MKMSPIFLVLMLLTGVYAGQQSNDVCQFDTDCAAFGVCVSSMCICKDGYIGDGWTECDDVDECLNDPAICHKNATCTNVPGSFTCDCNQGFSGDGSRCIHYLKGSVITLPADNNCSVVQDKVCHLYANCTQLGETLFKCECISGSKGDGLKGETHTGCLVDDLSCFEDPTCHHPNGMCSSVSRYCWCFEGYTGDGRYECTDIDECKQDVCDPNARCENTPGSFVCNCLGGYIGDGFNCTYFCNVDSDCHSDGICIDGLCSCKSGFNGDGRERCDDINECIELSQTDCSVHASCTNTQGSYTCECKNGYQGTGKDCNELPSTCHDIFENAGSGMTGKFVIDPDGIGPLKAVEVTCEVRSGIGVTVLNTVDTQPKLIEEGLNNVLYEQSYDHIKAVIDKSGFCSQSVSYSCLSGGKLIDENKFYWIDGSDRPQINWGGATSGLCLCGQLNKCHQPGSVCNCDGSSGSQIDAGRIIDRNLLPLKAVYNGNNLSGDKLSVGEIICGPNSFDFPKDCNEAKLSYNIIENQPVMIDVDGPEGSIAPTYVYYFPKDCNEAKLSYNIIENQPVMIDVDGPEGSIAPTYVYCNMSYEENVGITEIAHSLNRPVELKEDDTVSLNYAVDDEAIKSLISQSEFCSQDVKYICQNSSLMLSGQEFQWHDVSNDTKKYFPGALGHENKCPCGVTGTCDDKNAMCNCDIKDGVVRSDFGTIIDKNELPITQMKFPDVGSGHYAKVSVGSLKCSKKQFGIPTNCERIFHAGYKQDYAYLIDPDGPRSEHHGDLNNAAPFLTECDMDAPQSHGVTVVHHNQENPVFLSKSQTSVKLEYKETTLKQMKALKDQSTFCEQKLHLKCGGLPIFDPSGYRNVYWMNVENHNRIYFSGNRGGGTGCQCSVDKTCVDSSLKCNCDSRRMDVEDIGYIGYMHDLPITEFGISFTGRMYLWSMEGRESSLGLKQGEEIGLELEIGPLRCYNIYRDCEAIYWAAKKLNQKFVDGIYTIDPDGPGGVSPFSVDCRSRQTLLRIDPSTRWKYLWGWYRSFHQCTQMKYLLGASHEQVQALVTFSRSCAQSLLYMCKNAPLIGYTYYKNCKGERQPGVCICEIVYSTNRFTVKSGWAGGGGTDKCFCGAAGGCPNGPDKKCKCDDQDNLFHLDQAPIIDKNLLPVCEVCLNIEPFTEDIRIRYAYFYVADLYCSRFHASALSTCQLLRDRTVVKTPVTRLSYIDPDGYYGEVPYPALCTVQSFPPIGYLETRPEQSLYTIPEEETVINISYAVSKMDYLLKSIDRSKYCQQKITFHCSDAELVIEKGFGLYDRNGNWIKFWAGNEEETTGCEDGICNCNGTGIASDGGLIKDKSLLPITQVHFLASSGLRNLSVGSLNCYELYEDCGQIRLAQRAWNPLKNNTYAIDPDQGGGVEPFGVLCDFKSDSSIGITEVGFPSKENALVLDVNDFGTTNRTIHYDSSTPKQLHVLVERSNFCYQTITIECQQTALVSGNSSEQNYAFYYVTDGSSATSFGSGFISDGSSKCACSSVDNSCPTGQNCYCDVKTSETTSDIAVVMDKDYLPVSHASYWGQTLPDAKATFALSTLRCGPKPFDFPRDCEEALSEGHSTGEVMIRPRSYTTPFFVYCDMEMVPGHGVTVIGNDLEEPLHVTGETNITDVIYNSATTYQVEDLTYISSYCFQPMRFRCFNTEFVGKQKFYWQGYYHKYRFDFAGGKENSIECQCGKQRTCGGYDGWWSMYTRQCNCDFATDQEWRVDAGIVNGTGDLPIERIAFENNGMSRVNSQGFLDIGKLYCAQKDFDLDECIMGFHDCHELATCINTFGAYTCECNQGYRSQGLTSEQRKVSWSNGRQCFDDNECRMGLCPWSADCVNTPGSFVCTCKSGFNQTGPLTCIDLDECSLGIDNCDKNADCVNTHGSFLCLCNRGYRGPGTVGECYGYGICMSFGDPHYISYDGAWTHFQGQCKYILSESDTPPFTVYAQNWDYDRGLTGVAWIKEVHVSIGGNYIEMLQEKTLHVNGYKRVTSIILDDGTQIEKTASHVFLTTDFGLQVIWDGRQIVKLKIPSALQNTTRGICANFDMDPSNDMLVGPQVVQQFGKITDSYNVFGHSWIDEKYAAEHPDCSEILDAPECTAEERAVARGWCSSIFSLEKAQECIRRMKGTEVENFIEGFLESCIFDTCNNEDKNTEVCNIAEAFITACQELFKLTIPNWRNKLVCDHRCGLNQHYEACGYLSQQLVCHNVTNNTVQQKLEVCEQGCFCDENFLLDNGECVKPEYCSCLYEGNYYMVNQEFSINNCTEMATCLPNNTVVIVPSHCHGNASCRFEDGVYGCHCNPGYDGDGHHNCTYNPCQSNPCIGRTECIPEGNGYICECLPGYYADCEACYDINECDSNEHECDSRANCVNTDGSYTCSCPHGYISFKGYCVDVDECIDDDLNECSNNSKCVNKVGSYECICCDGYLANAENECTVIDSTTEKAERKCCVCVHDGCDDPSPVCGEDGITYPSYKDLAITECRNNSTIGMDYKGPCTKECTASFNCPSIYQKCTNNEVTGQVQCDCMPCDEQTIVQTITEEVCSTTHILYRTICSFIEIQCALMLNDEIVPNNNIQLCIGSGNTTDTLAEPWSTWSSCSVTCGQGVKKRTREISPTIREDLLPLFPTTVTSECFEAPCNESVCGNITCGKPGAVCIDLGNDTADCVCKDCRNESDDYVCANVGTDMLITYQNPCTVEMKACKLNEPFEILNKGYCGEDPVECTKMPDIRKYTEYQDQNCTFKLPLNLGKCSGGCGEVKSDLCCKPIGSVSKSVEISCPNIPGTVMKDFAVITDCHCVEPIK